VLLSVYQISDISSKMEIVNENEETDAPHSLEAERSRMISNVQKASAIMAPPGDGPVRMPSRKPSVMRGAGRGSSGAPMRSSSMRASVIRPLAPTKSTDCMASMRGTHVQRANSSRIQRSTSGRGPMRGQVLRTTSSRCPPMQRGPRAAPNRTSSVDSTNSLRAYRRDALTNSAIEPMQPARIPGPGATLERHTSDMSLITTGDLSCFTMDSVNLRKNQMVADPLEDATYNEMDSCADHESVSRASVFSEYQASFKNGASGAAAGPTRLGVYRTPSRIGGIKFDSLQISSGNKKSNSNNDEDSDSDSDDDDKSFGTMTSGLTTDFTEHDELLNSDDDDDDDDDEEFDED
jgi:hypothetical protein